MNRMDEQAFRIAISSLAWSGNAPLVASAEKVRDDGFNNHAGHMSAHMCGRLNDAYFAARAALTASGIDSLMADNERLREALEWIAERAKKLRKGTDDWFELVEFEAAAMNALRQH